MKPTFIKHRYFVSYPFYQSTWCFSKRRWLTSAEGSERKQRSQEVRFPRGHFLRVLPGKAYSDLNFGQAAEFEAHGVSVFLTLTPRSESQSLPQPARPLPQDLLSRISIVQSLLLFGFPHHTVIASSVAFFFLGNKSKPQTTKHPLWPSTCTVATISTVQTQTWDT